MNWILKLKRFGESIKKNVLKKFPSKDDQDNSQWTPLNCCNSGPTLKSDLEEHLFVCPNCKFNHTINPKTRFDMMFGENNWEEINCPLPPDNPLNFVDSKPYSDRLKSARKKTGQDCAVLSCVAKINEVQMVVSALNFDFMGASIATSECESLIFAIQTAINKKCSFVLASASGGMRMQEGILSLQSMAKLTIAINELKKNNLPFVVLYCAPATAGGTTASITSLSDIAMAEEGVTIAFSGKRVVAATVREQLDENIQRSDWVLDKGFLDLEVERKDIPNKLYKILSILLKLGTEANKENNDETSENIVQITKAAS